MAVFNNILAGASGQAVGAYEIERSLRFNSSDSAYLSKNFGSAGNRKTWTWSGWVKRTKSSSGATYQSIFTAGIDGNNNSAIVFDNSDGLEIWNVVGNVHATRKITSQVFRDFSSWYHLVISAASSTLSLYVNGVEVSAWATNNQPGNEDWSFNAATTHYLARYWDGGSSFPGDFYLADVHFIDGQALDPTSFTEVDATTGQLVPIEYTGTFGTNGFHLPFSDNSTAAALGTDTSGNGNTWTTHNVSVELGGPTSVAAATGALPIYNTTDTYGTVKGTGVRSDANASYLSLCLPLEGSNGSTTFTDESPTGRTSSTKTFTPSGNAQISTSQSYFYGSSCYLDGTGDYLTSSATGTDMTVGAGAFTLEFWGYFNSFSGSPIVLSAGTGGFSLGVNSSGQVIMYRNGPGGWGGTWTAQTLSTSTWYHIAAVTSSGSGGVWTVYINGVSQGTQSGWSGEGTTSPLYIGGYGNGVGTQLPNGYFSDIRIYKGTAKYTSNFNPPSATLNPTVAAGNDSLVDTPTNYGTDTGAGGEVRGNYATLNPLNVQLGAGSLSNGNLDLTGPSGSSAYNYAGGTFGIDTSTSTGWYFEFTQTTYGQFAGVALLDQSVSASSLNNLYIIGHSFANQTAGISYANAGALGNYGTLTTGLTTWTSNGDVIGVAIKDNKIWFAKNNTWISGSPSAGTSPSITLASTKYVTPAAIGINSSVLSFNAGQRAFAYTAPSGFKALCTTNLPDPLVAKPSEVMDVVTWSGDNANPRSITTGFEPDLVWIKARNQAYYHTLYDSVRTATARALSSNTNDKENGPTNNWDTSNGYLSSFDPTGFTLTGGSTANYWTNRSGVTYVAWAWDAGSSTVSNTDGSITSQVRANASAGFSIVTATLPATNTATIGHGLNAEPYFIIVKVRDQAINWDVYHKNLGNTGRLILNLTNASSTAAALWGSTTPTSTVFTIGSNGTWYNDGDPIVAYCFAPVAGYSSFGSYTGNDTSNFVYLGFRPALVIIKNATKTGSSFSSWMMQDAKRSPYNPTNGSDKLWANRSTQEGYRGDGSSTSNLSANDIDFTSNGFYIPSSSSVETNETGQTYIYAAFAESPFKTARAR